MGVGFVEPVFSSYLSATAERIHNRVMMAVVIVPRYFGRPESVLGKKIPLGLD